MKIGEFVLAAESCIHLQVLDETAPAVATNGADATVIAKGAGRPSGLVSM
jgi:hypothetical protein